MSTITPEERETLKAEVRAIYQEVADEFRAEFKEDMIKVGEDLQSATAYLQDLIAILNELRNSDTTNVFNPDELKENIIDCVQGRCNRLSSQIEGVRQKVEESHVEEQPAFHCQYCGTVLPIGVSECPNSDCRAIYTWE